MALTMSAASASQMVHLRSSSLLPSSAPLGAFRSAVAPTRYASSSRGHANLVVSASIRQDQESDAPRAAVLAGSTVGTAALALSAPGAALADVDVESVSAALNKVESFVQQATATATTAYDYVRGVVGEVVTAATPLVEAATPVVKDATSKALEAASPVAADLVEKAKDALTSAGVDTAPVYEAAKTAASVAGEVSEKTSAALTTYTPAARGALETLLAQDPLVLAGGAGGLTLLYLLAPSLLGAALESARGFAGELTAPQTLDLLTSSEFLLVDVRTEKERSRSGNPALPRNAAKKRFNIPVEELPSKLRGQLRNARKVEAELTALKIAALKKLGKNSKIAILDSNGSTSRLVAKALTNLGFRSAYVVKDGTDGGSGWFQSQLAMESSGGSSFAEVLSPSRIIPASTGRFSSSGTSRGEVVDLPPVRRGFLLPGGVDE